MKISTIFGRTSVLTAGLALMLWAPALHASFIWDWTFTSTLHTGSGTIESEETTTTIITFTGYAMIAVTGTFDGEAITGLIPFGDFGNSNQIADPPQQLDDFGFAFTTSTGNNRIWHTVTTFYEGFSTPLGGDDGLGSFVATRSAEAVPEPGTWVLIGSTLLLLAVLVRRRHSSAT